MSEKAGGEGVERAPTPSSEEAINPSNAAPQQKVEEVSETVVEENVEKSKTVAKQRQGVQVQQESTPPFVSDVPSLTSPFGEVTSHSMGLTCPGTKLHIYPHFSLTGIFDDNVFLSSNHKVSDFYFALSPGVGFAYGADESALKMRADYTASFLLFSKESSQDTVDQNATMRFLYTLPKLTLGLNLGFQSLSGASVDVGDRVRRQIYYIGVTSNYVLDEKFSVDLNVDETAAQYKGYLDSTETRVQSWLNYQATGKLQVGVGATFGFLDVQSGPGQTYEELLGRATYDATGKLVLFGSAGVDFRQTDTDTVAPVFSLGAAYSPFSTTTITVDVHERIYGSASLVGQDYRATGFLLTVNQQLRPDLSAFLSVGYENASYFAVKKDIAADRVDHFIFARIGPQWQIRPWVHTGAFYEFSRNASSGIGERSFTRNRVGAQVNFFF